MVIDVRALAALIAFWVVSLGGCYPPTELLEDNVAALEAVETMKEGTHTPRVDWAKAPGCRDKLRLLQEGLSTGSVASLEATPFKLVSDEQFMHPAGWAGPGRSGLAGLKSTYDDPAKPCVIRMGEMRDHKTDHQLISRERVRSSYRSGSHREKNPAYDAAQARLRQAEKANKPGKSSVITVGDPLIDLVGTLIGGAITGVGQWSQGDQVEEAIDALMATPRSIEQPIYRAYQFERARIRASREAVIPVIMTDRLLQRSWRISLKRREIRDLAILEGLDRQDRDYANHRESSMTDQEFRQWQAEPPELPLEDMIASLLRAPTAPFVDRIVNHRSADLPRTSQGGDRGGSDVGVLDAAALPPSSSGNKTTSDRRRPISLDGASAISKRSPMRASSRSLLKIIGDRGSTLRRPSC